MLPEREAGLLAPLLASLGDPHLPVLLDSEFAAAVLGWRVPVDDLGEQRTNFQVATDLDELFSHYQRRSALADFHQQS